MSDGQGTGNAERTARRALVAEDEGMTVLLLRRALEAAGYDVVAAVPDGERAVESALSLRPDFILMDINMPGMNGIEATRRIVAQYPVPVIVLTAYSEAALVDEAVEAGACAYLVKPVTAEQVAPAVRVALARFDAFERIRAENATLSDSLETRKLVERAKGVLMQRLRLSEPDAFRRLQKAARDKSQTLKHAAQEVIRADDILGEA